MSSSKLYLSVLVLGLLGCAILVFASTRPDTFRVERTMSIHAPPEAIFPLINDFHEWPTWSPYERRDPSMKRTYGRPSAGIGAVYEWDGNEVGAGRMEISESSPPSHLVVKLDFRKPMEAHNYADFTLQKNGDFTNVTWAMYGPSSWPFKIMHLVFDMDRMVGSDFEEGLAHLKAQAEHHH